jgi:uncharacterized GH25 family protein
VGFLAFSTPILDARNALMRLFCFLWLTILAWIAAPELRGQNTGFKYLEVTVVDPDGKPLADVPVEISLETMKFPMPTDADGVVAINIPTGGKGQVELFVRHPGYAAQAVAWKEGNGIPDKLTIHMLKGVQFGGVVHDEQGKPIAGAKVDGIMTVDKKHGYLTDGTVVTFLDGELATTDDEGRWECSLAPEDNIEFQLRFSHPKFVDQGGFHSRGGDWDELKGMKKVVVLEQGFTVSGTILDPEGHPASRARVDITSIVDGSHRGSQNFADGEGRFETLPVPAGKATLSVIAPGLAPLRMEVDPSNQDELLALHLEKGQPIQIKVVNRAGEPLAKANVLIADWHYTGSRLDLDNRYFTDEQGMWRWESAPNEELTYQIWAPGYRESKHLLTASEEVQTVTLEPAVKITGNVIDKQTREPITKFRLIQIASIDCGLGCNSRIAYGDIELTTGGDYIFQTGLLCKESHISCSADGYKNGISRPINPDEDEVAWDFELEPEEKGKP